MVGVVRIQSFGGPEQLVYEEVEIPPPGAGVAAHEARGRQDIDEVLLDNASREAKVVQDLASRPLFRVRPMGWRPPKRR